MATQTLFKIFTPKIGEDEPILTVAYFSDGWGNNHQPGNPWKAPRKRLQVRPPSLKYWDAGGGSGGRSLRKNRCWKLLFDERNSRNDSIGFKTYLAKKRCICASIRISYANSSSYLAKQAISGFKLFGMTYIFSRENKPFKLFFQGPGRLSEKKTWVFWWICMYVDL